MKNRKYLFIAATVAIALVMLAGLSIMFGSTPAQAGPMAAPTPVAGTYTGGSLARAVTLFDSTVTTSTAVNGAGANILTGDRVDLQYVIDQGTTNTVTVKLQFSNDGTNWVDGPTIVTDNTADANVMQQYLLFGQYVRANVDAANTNDLGVKVIGVVR